MLATGVDATACGIGACTLLSQVVSQSQVVDCMTLHTGVCG